jgi:hypothetical protein
MPTAKRDNFSSTLVTTSQAMMEPDIRGLREKWFSDKRKGPEVRALSVI